MKHGDKIKLSILEAGRQLWRENPNLVNATNIAKKLSLSRTAVTYYFRKNELTNAVAKYSIEQKDFNVILNLISTKHPLVKDIHALMADKLYKQFEFNF